MTSTTSVAITREASLALDSVAKQTGLSKLYLASTVIKMFFDPVTNPSLADALTSFHFDRKTAEQQFLERVTAFTNSKE